MEMSSGMCANAIRQCRTGGRYLAIKETKELNAIPQIVVQIWPFFKERAGK